MGAMINSQQVANTELDLFQQLLEDYFQKGYIKGYCDTSQAQQETFENVILGSIRPMLAHIREYFEKQIKKECRLKVSLNHIENSVECILLVPETDYIDVLDPVSHFSLSASLFLRDKKIIPPFYDFSISALPWREGLDYVHLCNSYPIDINKP